MTVEELSNTAKTALIDTVQIVESTIESIEDLLEVFNDMPTGVSVTGLQEIRNLQMTLRSQLMMLNGPLNAFNPPVMPPMPGMAPPPIVA